MKKFISLYLFFLAFFFIFFYADTSALSVNLNEKQIELTIYLLKPFLKTNQIIGIDIWINPYYKIYISQACNGFIPLFFLWSAILAYPSKIYYKLLWLPIGYVTFSIVNVMRLLLVVYFVEHEGGRANFYWSHDLLGNAILMATGLSLFILFIKTTSKTLSH